MTGTVVSGWGGGMWSPGDCGPGCRPDRLPERARSSRPLTGWGIPPMHMGDADHADRRRPQPLSGLCAVLLSRRGVFRLHGEEALMYDPGPEEGKPEQVLRAAAACPVQPILVEADREGAKGKAWS